MAVMDNDMNNINININNNGQMKIIVLMKSNNNGWRNNEIIMKYVYVWKIMACLWKIIIIWTS
jgi:hypothetical protein